MPENEKNSFGKRKECVLLYHLKKTGWHINIYALFYFFLTKKDYICNEMLNSYK